MWPQTKAQRRIFHALCQAKRHTASRPRLQAGVELYGIAKALPNARGNNDASHWLADYLKWREKREGFLAEATIIDGREELAHERLAKAKKSLGKLISSYRLLAHLDESLTPDGHMPATSNRIEGGASSPIRRMLREHRRMSLMRRIKAVFCRR